MLGSLVACAGVAGVRRQRDPVRRGLRTVRHRPYPVGAGKRHQGLSRQLLLSSKQTGKLQRSDV